MVFRYGSWYLIVGSNVDGLGRRIGEVKKKGGFKMSGDLGFLNEWRYELG